MFSKKAHSDLRKSTTKVLDAKRDTAQRFKHLRNLLDHWSDKEVKEFFNRHYSHIFYILYESFINVEADLHQRVNKAHKEELEHVLSLFERVLLLLPDLVHKRWQSHSIGRLMRKLLHPLNTTKIRREGMRLFLLWYGILQHGAPEVCHTIYSSLVPDFGSGEMAAMDLYSAVPSAGGGAGAAAGVLGVEMTPVIPVQQGDKKSENLTRHLLESLVFFMVSEVSKVEWEERHKMQELAFCFLFDRFKAVYLHRIFPQFCPDTDVFSPPKELPESRSQATLWPDIAIQCQEVVVKWMVSSVQERERRGGDTITRKNSNGDWLDGNQSQLFLPDSESATLTYSPRGEGAEGGQERPDTPEVKTPAPADDVHIMESKRIAKRVMFSSRENVNIIHELFRLGLQFPYQCGGTIKRILKVYNDWFHGLEKPEFMLEPLEDRDDTPTYASLPSIPEDGAAPKPDEIDGQPANASGTSGVPELGNSGDVDDESPLKRSRSDSYRTAMKRDLPGAETVRAGLQSSLQLFITNSANIFLLQHSPASGETLREQYEMCTKVIGIYRAVVTHLQVDHETWRQLLTVLLHVTSGLLRDVSPPEPSQRDRSLSARLAQPLFLTLIVTWIKANLSVRVSEELWDHFLAVLSSLTQWHELIKEWAKTMETLTRMMARLVYGLDLRDLPLDRLTEQKKKKFLAQQRKTADNSTLARGTAAAGGEGTSHPLQRGFSQFSVNVSMTPAINKKSARNPLARLKHEDRALAMSTGSIVDQLQLRGRSATVGEVGSPPLSLSHDHPSSESLSGLGRSSSDGNLADVDSPPARVKLASSEHLSGSIGHGIGHDEPTVKVSSRSPSSRLGGSSSCGGESPRSSVLEENYSAPWEQQHEDSSETHSFRHFMDPGDTSSLEHHSFDSMSIDKQLGLEDTRSGSPVGVDALLEEDEDDAAFYSGDDDDDDDVGGQDNGVLFHGRGIAGGGGEEAGIGRSQETLHSDDSKSQSSHGGSSKALLCGGSVAGWTPDASVVLWQRMLGCLGDVTQIRDPGVMAQVFDCLCSLLATLKKIRLNQALTPDDKTTPPPPDLVPPFTAFTPWLFKALALPNNFKRARITACRLLCEVTLMKHDIALPTDHLALFYKAVHEGLSGEEDMKLTLVRYLTSQLFCLPLPGASLLVLDLLTAAQDITAMKTRDNVPHEEAVTMLGCLLALPATSPDLQVLTPGRGVRDRQVLSAHHLTELIVGALITAAKKEMSVNARCLALKALCVFTHGELYRAAREEAAPHPLFRDAVNVLLATLRFEHRAVARVACSCVAALAQHCQTLLDLYYSEVPTRVIELVAATISSLHAAEVVPNDRDRKLIVELLFCLLEWALRLPLSALLEPTHGGKSRLHTICRVLYAAASGHSLPTPARPSFSFETLLSELDDLDTNVSPRRTRASEFDDNTATLRGRRSASMASVFDQARPENDTVQLAARTVLSALVNQLAHFPSGLGAARLCSTVHEAHDHASDDVAAELTADVFSAPNVQFLVLNNTTLLTAVELPADGNKLAFDTQGGEQRVLSSGRAVSRVIVRDLTGKHCWDGHVLFGPAHCRAGSFPSVASDSCDEPVPKPDTPQVETVAPPTTNVAPCDVTETPWTPQELPKHSAGVPTSHDVLTRLLEHVEEISPECVLYPGESLAGPAPQQAWEASPEAVQASVLAQVLAERDMVSSIADAQSHASQRVSPEARPQEEGVEAPFQQSRLLLNWLGLLSWDRRPHVELLKKSEQLVRELKNLDTQKCRETHKVAVLYVASGQEDKTSILTNCAGSTAFEKFVAGLGWEVELSDHAGFLGGLPRTPGVTMPYYASPTAEVMFHVATRLEASTDEQMKRKWRHLGNDEVQVVWSEHYRDYRRGILATEFADVIIAIYPLPSSGLCRVQLLLKPSIEHNLIGPLFDGALVEPCVLPPLVRETALNARRALSSLQHSLRPFYEERMECLERLVSRHKQATMFEDFAARLFSPVLPGSGLGVPGSWGAGHQSTPEPPDTPAAASEAPSSARESDEKTNVRSSRGSEAADTIDNLARQMTRRLSFKKTRSSKSSFSPDLPDSPKHRH